MWGIYRNTIWIICYVILILNILIGLFVVYKIIYESLWFARTLQMWSTFDKEVFNFKKWATVKKTSLQETWALKLWLLIITWNQFSSPQNKWGLRKKCYLEGLTLVPKRVSSFIFQYKKKNIIQSIFFVLCICSIDFPLIFMRSTKVWSETQNSCAWNTRKKKKKS